ncbi:MAG: TRCF domain-containing protein, partial [Candidatus Binatia bacterium]
LEDRFGPVPARVGALLEIMELRRHLKRAMVVRLRRQAGKLLLRFHDDSGLDAARLVAFASSRRDVRVLPDGELAIPVLRIDLEGISAAVVSVLRALGLAESAEMDTKEKKLQMEAANSPRLEARR